MDKAKRDRSANFSSIERDILVSLVQKYSAVIESKQCDSSTWKRKESAWRSIEKEFNARSEDTYRSTKTLKIKYEGLKRTVRKKSAALCSGFYRTGGRIQKAPPLNKVEEQVKAIMNLSAEDLACAYDSDTLPQTQESQDSINDIMNPRSEEIVVMPLLRVERLDRLDEVNIKREPIEEPIEVNGCVCEPLPPASNVESDTIKTENTEITWNNSLRRNLKRRKHPMLIGNMPKRIFDKLTQAKLELVQMQKEYLEAEFHEKKKVWEFEENERRKEAEFKEKERKWREEEHRLKLEEHRLQLERIFK